MHLSSPIIVKKFGGTSLEDGPAFQRVAHIISASSGANVVVVVSAMSGVTDALIKSFRRAAGGEMSEALLTLEPHFERHLKVAGSLGPAAGESMRAVIECSRREISELLEDVSAGRVTTAVAQDAFISQGERLSANLLTIVLERYGIPSAHADARRCIVTDEQHGNARPLLEETQRQTRSELLSLIESNRVPVLGGFIAATRAGVTTTLGRGSSDYSSTLVSAALGAHETQIWTDVDGLMTADPDLVESASTVPQISYQEAAELARLGARVLHSKMLQPVAGLEIPVRILNSRAPERRGTLISSRPTLTGPVKAIAHKTNLTTIGITSTPAFVANGFLRTISDIFDRHRVGMQIVGRSTVGVSLTSEDALAESTLVHELERVGSVEMKTRRAVVSCVGAGLRNVSDAETCLQVLKTVHPTLNWRRATDLSLVATVDPDLVSSVVQLTHQCLFQSSA